MPDIYNLESARELVRRHRDHPSGDMGALRQAIRIAGADVVGEMLGSDVSHIQVYRQEHSNPKRR